VKVAGLLALVLASGCGRPDPGVVSGTVLYKGKPIPGGLLTFRPAEPRENTVTARVDEHGHFEVTLPAGEVKIAFDNREFQRIPQSRNMPALPPGIQLPPGVRPPPPSATPPPAENAQPENAGRYVAIPDKYYNADTSGLSYTVRSGPQTYDIPLE
jgi:hypothetical protein